MKIVAFFAIFLVGAVYGDEQLEYINSARTYQEAVQFCEEKGRELYLPRNAEENKQLFEKMKHDHVRRAWIGLHVTPGTRNFVDKDSVTAAPTFWGPNEPNNNGGKENCGEMRVLDKNTDVKNWNDRPCDSLNPFYCGVVKPQFNN